MEHTDLKSMTQQNLPEDQQIVRLFFKRSEKAITYTRQKYGSLCISVARRILSLYVPCRVPPVIEAASPYMTVFHILSLHDLKSIRKRFKSPSITKEADISAPSI